MGLVFDFWRFSQNSRDSDDRKRHVAANELKTQDFSRILLIKPSSLGDVVRTLPILAGLRQRYPHAQISWMLRPDCAQLIRGAAALDEIIEFDRRRFGKMLYNWAAASEWRRFLKYLRARRFDLVLDLQGLLRSGFMSWACRTPVRVGFAQAREFASLFYTHRIPAPPQPEHVVETYWRFAEFLGFGTTSKVFAVPIPDSARQTAQTLLGAQTWSPTGGYAVLLPGGTEPAKCWPAERFGALATHLAQDYDMAVVLLGAGRREQAVAALVNHRANESTINLVGKTSLKEAAAILERARVVVGNDSGPLHIAAALAVPTVGLYGPTNPYVVGPYGQMDGLVQTGAQTCRRGRYSHRKEHQMPNISVEQVLKAVERKLARQGR